MKLSQLFYLFDTLIFVGTAILFEWSRNKKILKKYELVILALVTISIPFTATEYFALKWGAWFYNPDRTINYRFGTEIESYLFAAGITLLVAIVTLASAKRTDLRSNRKSRKSKPRKSSRVVGATKR